MLRNFLKNRKAQNTAEYALLIALVVAGVIAMQTYAQRALQARVRDASIFLTTSSSGALATPSSSGNTTQYEPYYLQTDYNVTTNSTENKRLGVGLDGMDGANDRTRVGSESSNYAAADMNQLQ